MTKIPSKTIRELATATEREKFLTDAVAAMAVLLARRHVEFDELSMQRPHVIAVTRDFAQLPDFDLACLAAYFTSVVLETNI